MSTRSDRSARLTKSQVDWLSFAAAAIAALSTFWSMSPCFADRAPQSAQELFESADMVIVGVIRDLKIQTEPAHIEQGFGNTDWAIDLTVEVQNVEKGTLKSDESSTVIARCFRIRSRRSAWEFLTPTGNHPIPGLGEVVRLHLYRSNGRYRVLYPNGAQAASASPESTVSPVSNAEVAKVTSTDLTDAAEVSSLPAPTFTFLISIEAWAFVLVVAGAGGIFVGGRKWLRKRNKPAG